MYLLGFDFDRDPEKERVRGTLTDFDLGARTRLLLLVKEARERTRLAEQGSRGHERLVVGGRGLSAEVEPVRFGQGRCGEVSDRLSRAGEGQDLDRRSRGRERTIVLRMPWPRRTVSLRSNAC